MSEKLKQTQSMLEKHHGNGEEFAKLMEETYAGRFNEAFWSMWDSIYISTHCSSLRFRFPGS